MVEIAENPSKRFPSQQKISLFVHVYIRTRIIRENE